MKKCTSARSVAFAVALGVSLFQPLVGAGVAFAQGAKVEEATPAQKKEAQSHYEKGAKLFELKKFQEAQAAFKASYDVVRSPNAHLMLARSHVELGQFPQAYRELVSAEEEAAANPKYAATLEKIRGIKDETKKKIALVKVAVVGTAKSSAFTAKIGTEAAALGEERAVFPGKLRVVILEDQQEKASKEVDLAAGEQRSIELTVDAPAPPPPIEPVKPIPQLPPPPPPSSNTGYLVAGGVIGGLGLVAVGIGTGLYVSAKSDFDDLEGKCGATADQCPDGSQQQIDDGKDKQAFAVISWIAGGATASLGIGLIIAGVTREPASDSKPPPPVDVGVGPGWLQVKTRF